ARGESIYSVDADLLESLAPDLIVTQDLCHVCAASPDDLAAALTRFSRPPRVLSLVPQSLADVWDDVRRVGDAACASARAEVLAKELARRVAAVNQQAAASASRPRVLCLEWLDPFYIGGHWVPEMVALAGGKDALAVSGKPSRRVTFEEIEQSDPDVIVVMQCGYTASRNAADFRKMGLRALFAKTLAARDNRIFAVDANGYFSRPGPRLADGVDILAHLLHPDIFPRPEQTSPIIRL
ncbi:MAG TPA: ABC transporter substrate-binding protein, partial [Candidatus Acidoferrum sp.]|nr:ABC transporter substrate-binding protein [Candidatus Acidoferrum sp.]